VYTHTFEKAVVLSKSGRGVKEEKQRWNERKSLLYFREHAVVVIWK